MPLPRMCIRRSASDPEPSTGRVDLVDTADPTLTRRPISVGAGQPVAAALFDGDELIVGSWDGTVTIVDVADPASPAITATLTVPALPPGTECAIDDGDRKVRSIAVDDSGRWLVAGTNHCLVVVWDRAPDDEGTTARNVRMRRITVGDTIFVDGFESGSTDAWAPPGPG